MPSTNKCAYHLCGRPFEKHRYGQQYCDPLCKQNAANWRWRYRHPAKHAADKARQRVAARKRKGVAYTKRRHTLRSLMGVVERMEKRRKKAAMDGRDSSAT